MCPKMFNPQIFSGIYKVRYNVIDTFTFAQHNDQHITYAFNINSCHNITARFIVVYFPKLRSIVYHLIFYYVYS